MNSQAFTPEEIKKGLHLDLLNYLFSFNQKSDISYYDIHITTDGYCTIIEWADVDYNLDCKDDCSKFVLLEPDCYIMKELTFPDNHTEMVFPNETESRLNDWLKENPQWVKTTYGTWTNQEENKKFKEMLGEAYPDEEVVRD